MGKLFLDFSFWLQGYRSVQIVHIVHCLHCTVINKLYRQTIDTVFTVWNIVILFSVFGLHFFDLKVHSSSSQQIITLSGFLKRQYFAFYDTLEKKIYTFSLCCRTVGELSCWPFENCSCASDHFLGSNSIQSN